MMTDSEKIYYIYHIPGQKVGVTVDPRIRVEKQQGYRPNQYEILMTTTDIDEVSKMEIEFQRRYGYKVDRKLYKNLNNKEMKINSTEQTSTFPVSVKDLEDFLNENKGVKWTTHLGEFEITDESSRWILNNIFRSQYKYCLTGKEVKRSVVEFCNHTSRRTKKKKKIPPPRKKNTTKKPSHPP